jgi:hypothetical protein
MHSFFARALLMDGVDFGGLTNMIGLDRYQQFYGF